MQDVRFWPEADNDEAPVTQAGSNVLCMHSCRASMIWVTPHLRRARMMATRHSSPT
ncbi:hypothetical protein XAC217_840004 [Xanthomonas citri pv. citri]|nr:hypothetical protein XAC1083_770004 [Xanthomonas citri pv. citri]CEE86608.1 hypothetical protein XACLC80_960009 [Xanthomonas citri pv. citri]CEF47300.1 hypothetical protein XAC217_840004 [Xanthomonas citri pv. citri]